MEIFSRNDFFAKLPGVSEVNFGQDWVKNYASLTKTIQSLSTIVAIIIIFASIFVISNSIQSSVHQRRNEIEVLDIAEISARVNGL